MDRFLQEVTDEAHLGAHTSGGSSHLAPHPLFRGEADGVENVTPDENGPVVVRVIKESAEYRSRRERETDRFHITEHPHPLSREGPEALDAGISDITLIDRYLPSFPVTQDVADGRI
jgi:hypothetical protein